MTDQPATQEETNKKPEKWRPSFMMRKNQDKTGGATQKNPSKTIASPNLKPDTPPLTSTPAEPVKLKVVEIDSLVLVKVIKHCRENYPSSVNGQLLGLDNQEKLEVTNCFPLPQKEDITANLLKEKHPNIDIEERVEEELEKYQDKMTELMHDVNIDCFTVGWYQTLNFGDLKNKEIIESLVLYQELVDKAILLGFDPLLNGTGRMAFKAYHVSDRFLSIYHNSSDSKRYNELQADEILVEIPIIIRNAPLTQAYLYEWSMNDPFQNLADFNTLELYHNDYLEKNLISLSSSLENLMEEQDILQKYQREYVKQMFNQKQLIERNKFENEQRRLAGEETIPLEMTGPIFEHIEPPSQLNTLLLSYNASVQSKEIKTITSEVLAKMYLLAKSHYNKNQ